MKLMLVALVLALLSVGVPDAQADVKIPAIRIDFSTTKPDPEPTTAPSAPTHTQTQADSLVSATCKSYVGLTNHVAGCVRDTLKTSTARFFTDFYPMVSRAIGAAMTIAVALFGMMAGIGMLEKVGRDSIILLLKIAMVSYFAMNSDMMYTQVTGLMDSTAQSVMGFVPSSGPADNSGKDFSQVTCLKNMINAQQVDDPTKGVGGPWLAMDCMIDTVVGIKMDSNVTTTSINSTYNEMKNAKDKGLSRGLLYLFFASYHSSVMGFILAIIGFVFLWGMMVMVIKALFIYLAGYIGIAVMMIVSPLFIPMVLFQSTKVFFDKWVKLVISFALQPIIILVFITFSISAVDLATFSGDYSMMYRIAGDASRVKGFSLNTYLSTPVAVTPATNPPTTKAPIDTKEMVYGQVKGDVYDAIPMLQTELDGIAGISNSKCTATLMAQDADLKAKCTKGYAMKVYTKSLDWDQLAAMRSPAVVMSGNAKTKGEQLSREVLAAAVFAGIVIFVMNQLLQVIPLVAYDLVGDFGQSPNLGQVGGALPGGDKLKQAMQGMVTQRSGGAG